ncbi:DNA polymerase I [Candidatus Saccharibacteria bacterium]|nr:DNA polymerase I [Candidatus Saccharibacteria bacterium]
MTKRLAVIDGKSIFYRGYYAMPNLSLEDGTPTGGVYGFASLAIELIKKLEPDYVAVAWDKKGTNIRKRLEIYPEYKAGRKKAPDDFYEQIPILHELLEAFGWPLYELDDYEADDIMGAFAVEATKKGIETCLLTSDLDALQLVGPLVKVYALKNGLSHIEEFHEASFEKKYGIRSDQFLDLKSLMGDSSDNLPGVPGIGPKTGIDLLKQFETLDGVYNNLDKLKPQLSHKLEAGKKSAYMTKELARIWTEAPVKLDWDVADVNDTNLEKVAAILKRLEFSSLISRLPKHMQFIHEPNLDLISEEQSSVSNIEWPESLSGDGPIVINVKTDELWVSEDSCSVAHKKLSEISTDVWREIENRLVVSYDFKDLYHRLDSNQVEVNFKKVHDIRQSAFLIDPLTRDRTLAGLSDVDVDDKPRAVIAASWRVYKQQVVSFKSMPTIERIANEFDFPLIKILFAMEKRGVKIDPTILKSMSTRLSENRIDLEQKIYALVGYEFNIASPMQLSEVLFTKLQLPTAGIKRGKTGYSTGQKELDKLRSQHPIIELIEQIREIAKMKNTYVDVLPELADSDNRLHTTFNQDTASTGRLSSTDPNLQNIPIRSDLGREIRQAFIAEEGNVLVSADYSQFELRLAAFLAGDQRMINDFNSDVDIHTKTASEVYGVPLDDVTKNQRRNAKVINFGILYGMSPHGLSAATGMSFSEAKKFIDEYFILRKPIREYINETIKKARTIGYVETYFGRRRPTPDVHSSNFMVRTAAERAAANMPIQGTEADLMKLAMIAVENKLNGLGQQILQIHDSILVEAPKENAQKIADMLVDVMENIAPEISVKLKVDVHIGRNWGEL